MKEFCSSECLICAHSFDSTQRLPSLIKCAHSNTICSICFLRIRSLQRNLQCPTCKADLEYIICVRNEGANFSDFPIWGASIGHVSYQLVFISYASNLSYNTCFRNIFLTSTVKFFSPKTIILKRYSHCGFVNVQFVRKLVAI
jgi:hypothetical protein